jgi:hypothetical protein
MKAAGLRQRLKNFTAGRRSESTTVHPASITRLERAADGTTPTATVSTRMAISSATMELGTVAAGLM